MLLKAYELSVWYDKRSIHTVYLQEYSKEVVLWIYFQLVRTRGADGCLRIV